MMTSSNENIFRVTGPFVRGIHRWPVVSLHKDQCRVALMFSLICAGTNGWENNRDTGDFWCYDVTAMMLWRHCNDARSVWSDDRIQPVNTTGRIQPVISDAMTSLQWCYDVTAMMLDLYEATIEYNKDVWGIKSNMSTTLGKVLFW